MNDNSFVQIGKDMIFRKNVITRIIRYPDSMELFIEEGGSTRTFLLQPEVINFRDIQRQLTGNADPLSSREAAVLTLLKDAMSQWKHIPANVTDIYPTIDETLIRIEDAISILDSVLPDKNTG